MTATARSVFVVVVFVASLTFTVAQASCGPGDAPIERFAAALQAQRALIQPGDVVLVHPPWRDDAVARLRHKHPGHVITEAFAPRHGDPWPSLVVVADASWPLPAVVRARAAGLPRHERDGVDVVRIPAASAASDFDLARARVFVSGDDGEVACPWSPQRRRHVCAGLPEWMTVGEDTLTIAGRQQRCVWAHPKTDHTLVIDYGVVDVSAGVALSLALSDGAADNPTGAPVTARLIVGDREQTITAHRERGFHDVGINAIKGQAAVRLELTTQNDGQRHACFRIAAGEP